MKTLKTVNSIKNWAEKRVIIREDFNVPIKVKEGKVEILDDERILAAIPTIRWFKKQKAKIILISHLGRPESPHDHLLSLYPVARRLEKILKEKIDFIYDVFEMEIKERIDKLPAGKIAMIENIRFFSEEEADDPKFSKYLAGLGDYFVMDAFATAHRDDASTEGITRFLPSMAGPLLEKEVTVLSSIIEKPKRPFVAILGGAKISTKLGLVNKMLEIADKVILGGALTNTLFAAHGISVGTSKIEKNFFGQASQIPLDHPKLILPIDAVAADSLENPKIIGVKKVDNIGSSDIITDIGPKTAEIYAAEILKAKQIVWNGPMGFYENRDFSKGTEAVARAVAKNGKNAIIGGGETIDAVRDLKLDSKIAFISTGGGAMLEFLEGKELPGIKNLYK